MHKYVSGGANGFWTQPFKESMNPWSLYSLHPTHTGHVMRPNAKNGYLLHYLHSAVGTALLCVNTLTDNSCFH